MQMGGSSGFVEGQCPYCGERMELFADASAGAQDYVEDCPVCCRPVQVSLSVSDEGAVALCLRRDDEA